MSDAPVTGTIMATVEPDSAAVSGTVVATVSEPEPAPKSFDETDVEAIDVTGDGGVLKKIIREAPEGAEGPLEEGQQVSTHYTGTLADSGKKFDSSRDKNQPWSFTLGKGQVIKGWDAAVKTMKVGERALLRLTKDYAYGDKGNLPAIPASATLDFDLEILGARPKPVDPLTHWMSKLLEARKTHGKDADHKDIADALANLGHVFFRRGDADRAMSLQQESLEMRRKLAGGGENAESLDLAMSLGFVASLLAHQKKMEEALGYFQKALAMKASVHSREERGQLHPDIAVAHSFMGRHLQQMGNLDLARKHLEQALVLLRAAFPQQMHPSIATTYYYLGHLAMNEHKFADSQHWFHRSALLKYKLLRGAHPEVADALSNAGHAAFRTGDLKESEAYFTKAAEVLTQCFGGNHPSVSNLMKKVQEVKQLMLLPKYKAKMRRVQKQKKEGKGFTTPLVNAEMGFRKARADQIMAELLAAEDLESAKEEAAAASGAAAPAPQQQAASKKANNKKKKNKNKSKKKK